MLTYTTQTNCSHLVYRRTAPAEEKAIHSPGACSFDLPSLKYGTELPRSPICRCWCFPICFYGNGTEKTTHKNKNNKGKPTGMGDEEGGFVLCLTYPASAFLILTVTDSSTTRLLVSSNIMVVECQMQARDD